MGLLMGTVTSLASHQTGESYGKNSVDNLGRFVGQRPRFLARLRREQGRLGKFDLRADGSEAELDCRQTGDAQRCKREPTSSPVPCTEIKATSGFKRVSSLCQDLL